MRTVNALFLVAAAAVMAATGADAYTCGCFKNSADASYLGLMCTAYYMPRMITGWGSPVNTWFSVDCSSCSVDYNCTRGGLGHRKVDGLPQEPPRTEAEKKAIAAKEAPLAQEHQLPSGRRVDKAMLMTETKKTVAAASASNVTNSNALPAGVKGTGDPVLCCCYAKQEYYYTQGIHCDAINPESGNDVCQGSEYGAQNIGQWYVSDMDGQQCYFIVGQS
jgi:hypothetical protein